MASELFYVGIGGREEKEGVDEHAMIWVDEDFVNVRRLKTYSSNQIHQVRQNRHSLL